MKPGLKSAALLLSASVFSLMLFFQCVRDEKAGKVDTSDNSLLNIRNAVYTGRESCKRCHEDEYALHMGSDHDLAMDLADSSHVLGDFNNSSFTHFGITSKFYKKGGKYLVFTEGTEGVMKEFEIKYVFGYRPLQQYLIEFPGGRLQCLPICWDTRPKAEGGQRWFHIYDRERIKPDDILYWTGIMQNWNYMCAECHSTNLKKNYDDQKGEYRTTWTEIDVSCEACHGPGSLHVLWGEANEQGSTPAIPDMGLQVLFKDKNLGTWIFEKNDVTAKRSVPHNIQQQIETCARCHARRGVISEDYVHGKSFLDTHRPSLLDENIYYPDGQIQDEDYEYASYLQSKMFKAGVSCTDCHNPHSGKILVSGDALCYRCHQAEKYGSYSHHFHKPGMEGSQCVQCHMPVTKYMVVDPRLDHSIRIPRPDLSLKIGIPNACTQCHQDKSIQWAADSARKWYGDPKKYGVHYGEIIAEARKLSPSVLPELIRLSSDTSVSAMVRATAFSLLQHYNDPAMTPAIHSGLRDPDPLVRYAAVEAYQAVPSETIAGILVMLLNDSIRLTRVQSAYRLLENRPVSMKPLEIQKLDQVIKEYEHTQLINSDYPMANINLGNLYVLSHRTAEAENAFRQAIEQGPQLPFGYINLADLYRQQGREQEGEEILRAGLEKVTDPASIHHALALLLVRKGENAETNDHLKTAADLEPGNAQYTYTYGIALFSKGDGTGAIKALEAGLGSSPYDENLLYSLSTIHRDIGQIDQAIFYARQLRKYYPRNTTYQQLEFSLQNIPR
jgi:predicted CXXCH cytochrome family protein